MKDDIFNYAVEDRTHPLSQGKIYMKTESKKDFGIFKRVIGQYVIVRAPAGIFAGTLTGCENHDVIISDSRRLQYWTGASTISELSQIGVDESPTAYFPIEIPTDCIINVLEIIPCTEKAEKSIKDVKPCKPIED